MLRETTSSLDGTPASFGEVHTTLASPCTQLDEKVAVHLVPAGAAFRLARRRGTAGALLDKCSHGQVTLRWQVP